MGDGLRGGPDIAATSAITFWVPGWSLPSSFGLSMDYEVFILTRMSEEYRRTGDIDSAVVEEVGRTGQLVTGAAPILAFAFFVMATVTTPDIKIFGTALAIGIPLDAALARAFLLPRLCLCLGSGTGGCPAGWIGFYRSQESGRIRPESLCKSL